MNICRCGSNLPRRALRDGNGLFCAYVCNECEQRVRSKYRPEIMNRPYTQADVDECIEPDYDPPLIDMLEGVFGKPAVEGRDFAVFTLDQLQPVPLNESDGTWALYIFDTHGYHRGKQWFSKKIRYPDEEILVKDAWAKTVEAIANGLEVRVCDGGDNLVFHSWHGEVIHGKDFWKALGAE